MPYQVNCPTIKCYPFERLLNSAYCLTIFGYFLSNLVINGISEKEKTDDSNCLEEIMPYAWGSIVTILLLCSQCVFINIAIDTKGKFNDITSRDNHEISCCCCCGDYQGGAVCCWLLMLGTATTLSVFGILNLVNLYHCLPGAMIFLVIFGVCIQLISVIISLIALLFRCEILTYHDIPSPAEDGRTDPHPPAYS